MPFYSELFDTGLLATTENAAAKAVLMLRVMHDRPIDLTTSHSFSSQLIEECAKDPDFRSLVRSRRVRFKVRPDGTKPKDAFVAALSDLNYRFENWPQLLPDPKTGSIAESKERRKSILDVLNGRHAWTGDNQTDTRLSVLINLFSDIEWSAFEERELPRAGKFSTEMEAAHRHVPNEYPEVKEFVRKLGMMNLSSRSAAYNAIDSEDSSLGDFAEETRGVVDSVLNKTLAKSLGQQLLSIHRRIPLLSTFNGSGNAGFSSVAVERADFETSTEWPLDKGQRMRRFVSLEIKWKDIAAAMEGKGEKVHPDDAAAARYKLAKALAQRRFLLSNATASAILGKAIPKAFDAVPTILTAASAIGGAAGGWYIPHFDGALGEFARMLGSSPTFAAGAGVGGLVGGAVASTWLKEAATKNQTKRIEQVINGWLDDCNGGAAG